MKAAVWAILVSCHTLGNAGQWVGVFIEVFSWLARRIHIYKQLVAIQIKETNVDEIPSASLLTHLAIHYIANCLCIFVRRVLWWCEVQLLCPGCHACDPGSSQQGGPIRDAQCSKQLIYIFFFYNSLCTVSRRSCSSTSFTVQTQDTQITVIMCTMSCIPNVSLLPIFTTLMTSGIM